jgi:hypothetical protein
MKKVFLYVATCVIIGSSFAAAPGSKVLNRFNETFPNAKNVKWVDNKEGYFVSFYQNNNFNKVFYNKAGNFVYSLKYSNSDALPTNIAMAVREKFEGANILGVTEATTQTNTVYNIKLSKGEKIYCVDLLPDGTVAKQEEFINGNTADSIASN